MANFNNSEIINDKDILVSSKGKLVSSYGITSYDFNINDSQILNNGTISVSSEGVYADSAGMELDSLNNSQIINKGTIKADSTVINNSEDESFADSFGISIDYLNNSKIENNGSILVNSNKKNEKLTAYAEAISIEEANSLTLENSGTIKSTINNKLDKEAVAILFVNSDKSTVLNKAGGEIHGSVILYGDTTFNNKGSIYLPYNANSKTFRTFDDNDGKGEQTISFQPNFGNLVNSGTIEIGAYKDSEGNIENTQILAKTATFEKGSKMQVDVVAGSKAFVKGDTLSEVVTATDKLTINDLTLNQTKLADNSATLDFKYEVKDGKRIDLVVSDVKKLSDIVDNNKGNIATKNSIAKVFDYFRDNQNLYPQMSSVLSKIDTLGSNSEVINAINSLTPTTATSVVNSSSIITSNLSNIVSNRLGNLKSGLNSGDDLKVDNNRVWVKAFGSIGEQRDKDSISGFDLKTYGLGLGYDNEYKDGQIIGLSTFYTNANVETNGVNHKNDVDAYSIVAYGSNLLPDNKTTIYYQGSYTWQKNDSKRSLFTGDRADAKFTSKTFALDLKVGHKIAINDSFSVEPNIGTTYRHISNPSYTENGAGALNIHSYKFTSAEFLGNFGADFEYKITSDSKLTATIGAGYDFKDDDNIVTSSFAGASGVSFDTNGIDNGRWQYQAGIGYDVNLNNQNNLNFSYKYQGEGSKYNNNVVSLDYIYKF
ncbi:autotransporter outer membrane beta-barrel domain-containing protein [Aliarcobacter cryaerophilus]|uniref:autotransporter family protein n=1 Tax=Aliarcobacter cryaerophilus TaxID=28198 RepID=UPI0021B5D86F|nr:autotransporter outer membrane beta-barrel domain-containing protein [Aliarcobacter cryaerophilus]MCT7535755.1 autotransporter outer membrane beta-barrel domain-containing protein [Aliarcobacter cryaerophilus]